MNKDQLDYELIKIKKEYEQKIIEVKKKFADSNNPYKVGYIIQDHIGKGKIERIGYHFSFDTQCRYFCQQLKKDGTPRNDNSRRWIYQSNIEK